MLRLASTRHVPRWMMTSSSSSSLLRTANSAGSRLGSIRTAVNGIAAKNPKINGIKSHHQQLNGSSSLTSSSAAEITAAADPQRKRIVKSLLNTLQYAAAMDGSQQQHDHDDDDDDDGMEERWEIQVEVYVDDDEEEEEDDNHVAVEYPTAQVVGLSSNLSPALVDDDDATHMSTQQQQQQQNRPNASGWQRRVPHGIVQSTSSSPSSSSSLTAATPATATPATTTTTSPKTRASPSRFNHDGASWVQKEWTYFSLHNRHIQFEAKQMKRLFEQQRQQKQKQQRKQLKQQKQYERRQQYDRRQQQQQQQQQYPHQTQQQQVRHPSFSDTRNRSTSPSGRGHVDSYDDNDVIVRSIRNHKYESSKSMPTTTTTTTTTTGVAQKKHPNAFDQSFFLSHLTLETPATTAATTTSPQILEPPSMAAAIKSDFDDDDDSAHDLFNKVEYYLQPKPESLDNIASSERSTPPPPPSLYELNQPQQQQQQYQQPHHRHVQPQSSEQYHQSWPPPEYQNYPPQHYQQQHDYRPRRPMPHEEPVPSRCLYSERIRSQYDPEESRSNAYSYVPQQQYQNRPPRPPRPASAVFDVAAHAAKEISAVQDRLSNAIRLHQVDRAMSIFDDSRSRQIVLPEHSARGLFNFVVHQHPIFGYQVLKYIRHHHYSGKLQPTPPTPAANTDAAETVSTTDAADASMDDDDEGVTAAGLQTPKKFPVIMYRHLCKSVRTLDPAQVLHRHIRGTILPLLEDVRAMPIEDQMVCMPFLLASLLEQRGLDVNRQSQELYQYMIDNQFELSDKYFEHLLVKSKYTRQDDLPYHDVLQQLVKRGGQPAPAVVIQVLQNQFPFTDSIATSSVLRSILELQKRNQGQEQTLSNGDGQSDSNKSDESLPESTIADDHDDDDADDAIEDQTKASTMDASKPRIHDDYFVDMGMLYHIAAAAAKSGKHDVILLVWDILDMMGVEPTEGIYECSVHAFIRGHFQDVNAFAVLAEMEAKGFQPSRALTRSMSLSMRYSKGRVDHAYRLVTGNPDRVSFAALNAIMASCAELDDAEITFATLNDYVKFDLTPNTDTLSYALEAIGNEMEKDANKSPDRVRHFVAITGAVLNMSDDLGIAPCHHFIHEYVRILCRAGELETARQVLLQILEQPDGKGGKVLGRTLNMVAIINAQAGKYAEARSLLAASKEPTPLALKRIEFMEKGLEDPIKSTRYGIVMDANSEAKFPAEGAVAEGTSAGGLAHWRIRADPSKSML